MKNIRYWLPRILAILFICFISVFALDVFDKPHWPLALLMHLVPSIIAGQLWDNIGHTAVFLYGSVCAILGIILLQIFVQEKK